MAIIYRTIDGIVRDPQGNPMASGTLWVEAVHPVVDGEEFISPAAVSVSITNGVFSLVLASPVEYDFKVIDEYENTVWNFQAPLNNDATVPISLAELYLLRGQNAVDAPALVNPSWEWVAAGEENEAVVMSGEEVWVGAEFDPGGGIPFP